MKLLGIDFGLKRVGLAVSNPEATMSFPFKTIHRTTRDQLFVELLEILAQEKIEHIVLGVPPEGTDKDDGGPQLIVRQIRNFAQSLARRTPLPITFMDEDFSSYEAESALRDAGITGKKLKAVLDQQAAVVILESYLNLNEKPAPTYYDNNVEHPMQAAHD